MGGTKPNFVSQFLNGPGLGQNTPKDLPGPTLSTQDFIFCNGRARDMGLLIGPITKCPGIGKV